MKLTCSLSKLLCAFVCLVPLGSAFAQDHKDNPAQETVASKTAKFGTISSKNPIVKSALASKDLAGGAKLNGKKGSFVGVVTSVYSPKNHASLYIDFSEPWKNSISGFVKFSDLFEVSTALNFKGQESSDFRRFQHLRQGSPRSDGDERVATEARQITDLALS